ncbi:transmembrane protein 181 [Diorhabda carinulata]|uniref:transmembrane protein 181 n=1 Tax=Diorhabda carinulata TaxID=1163345 RepID=UPI0025A26815|nr:transmembrane protein 181 [Diorhabda carinulata]
MPTKSDNPTFGYTYHLPTGGWSAKLRNVLSQFSDIFSEFDKYIAPAYHHDRCERSVQMRLYSMHKRELCAVFMTFFISFGLGIFVGVAGPPITMSTAVDGISLLPKYNNTSKSIATGPFIMKTPKLSTYSQQLWIIAKLSIENMDGEIIDKLFGVSVALSGLSEEHKPVTVLDINSNNRSRHLKCEKRCDEFVVAHLGYLDFTHYIVAVKFYGLEAFHSRYNINELLFYFKTYNPSFTQIEIWFRFIFLISTFIITIWYQNSLRKYPMCNWSIEQKWISWLLPLLMAYDNPVFPMSFLINSWLPGMIDAFAQTTFICALLMFWLCIYHGLRQNDRHALTFYFPKCFIVFMMWLPAMILATWGRIYELQDPTFDPTVDTSNFYVVKAFFYIFGIIYFMYLSSLMLRAYSELRSMPYFVLRLRFLTLLVLIVLLITSIVTLLRYGVGVLEDSFVARLNTHYSNSSEFMCFYGVLNFYVYTMAYVYSPGTKDVHDIVITKDNPAFSMINDSDEDVIYGSEEESRQPLTQTRNDDDSD